MSTVDEQLVVLPGVPEHLVAEVLANRQSGLTAEEFLGVLEDVLRAATRSEATLTEHEVSLLLEAGVRRDDLSSQAAATARAELLAGAARDEATLVQRCLTTSQAAELLGISAARVRHRLAEGELVSIGKRDRTHLLPRWQFHGGAELPNLPAALAAAPAGMHPGDLERFMSTPDAALDDLTPIAWLVARRDPLAVTALLDDLTRW